MSELEKVARALEAKVNELRTEIAKSKSTAIEEFILLLREYYESESETAHSDIEQGMYKMMEKAEELKLKMEGK